MLRLPTCRLRVCSIATALAVVVGLAVLPQYGPGIANAADAEAQPDPVTDADREFWSFTAARRPTVPSVQDAVRVDTPIDAFLLNRLEADGLTFSTEADRQTLIRRASLDLTGIPPSPREVQAFVSDASPDAYEQLVDRLLTSPHFGERWGRHWLDVVGFVDTVGFDVDATLIITSDGKWRYRDYVINSFNADKPYDQFLTEQLAGDETVNWRDAEAFTPEILERLVATGYLRNAQDLTHEDVGNIPENHFGILNDTLEIVGSSLLGLTLNCARCHTHKFDPVPHEDYYRLMAAFTPAYNPANWKVVFPYNTTVETRHVADVAPKVKAEIDQHNSEIDGQVAALNQQMEAIRGRVRERLLQEKLAILPEPIRADTKLALETSADKRSEIQKYLAGKFQAQLDVKQEEVSAALVEADKTEIAKTEQQVAELNRQKRSYNKIQALYDVGPPPATQLLVRGDYHTPGPEVQPGVLRVLCESGNGKADLAALSDCPNPHSSGRRLALARWLTAPDTRASSLVARVMVNRIWQHLFGKGIVPTPENFGMSGEQPTHPELIEWLIVEFMHNGWRIKPLVKMMMTSAAYRQSAVEATNTATDPVVAGAENSGPKSDSFERQMSIDPDNRLLWKMRLKRLESEVIRDCVLSASDMLETSMGGPPLMLESQPDGMVVVAEKTLNRPEDRHRRSVYLLTRRAYQPTMLTVFDQPVVATNCPARTAAAVPLQSLTMLNSQFVFEQAELLAERVEKAAAESGSNLVNAAFETVLGRSPNSDEIQWCGAFLKHQSELYRNQQNTAVDAEKKARVHLCHTLLNTSEFLYAP